jgi:hypothetical protein
MILIAVCNRLDENVASHHPWKQLLGTASGDTRDLVLQTLEAYTTVWYPPERSEMPDDGEDLSPSHARVVDLCKAAEQDLEKGLSFIREVEKGSHMKADAVLRFRPEAIKAVCELCQGKIEELRPKPSQEDDEDDEAEDGRQEEEEDESEAKIDREGTTNIVSEGLLTPDSEAAKGLIGTVSNSLFTSIR